jgi:glycosyltransferase involved in cell wall biosynthesis
VKRALVIDPGLNSPGGGTCVAGHALQAIRDTFEVTLLSWHEVDFGPVNAAFGTDLAIDQFRFVRVPHRWRHALALCPFPLALLKNALLQRKARELLAREHFDLVISTSNEVDVGVRAIQYVHYPWAYYPRPDADYRWYHLPPLVIAYRGLAGAISASTNAGITRNETLVNSEWTRQRFRQWYGGAPRVLYPPVPTGPEPLPWMQRTDSFACIGRMSPEKNIEAVIDILAEVRRRGHVVSLLICGYRQIPAYERRILRIAGAHRDWITVLLDVPRAELIEHVARCRFGIHGMVREHFGIAIAEMVHLGCVCFAPADGGPAEILGNDQDLLYLSRDDAVEKICRMLRDPDALARARARLEARAALFSAQRFMAEFRRLCLDFVSAEPAHSKPLPP